MLKKNFEGKIEEKLYKNAF